MTRTHVRRSVLAAAAASTLLFVAACGSDDPDSDNSQDNNGDPSMSDSMDSMMGDPNLPPASTIEDAELTKGEFELLDTRPPGYDSVSGTAWLAQSDEGTTLTVRVTGLEADTQYMSHLHAQACSDDNGGPHFQFEKGGSEKPPNEVHLSLPSNDEGEAVSTVNNSKKVGDGARSVVVHPVDAMDNRIACADFS